MNGSRNNSTSADGSILGYLFQIERVIIWLSELSENDFIGVEVADDIVVQLAEGREVQYIYEQAKHTLGTAAPYSDKSEDLWKTLAIWVQAVKDGKVDPARAKFSLLSNRPLPAQRFVFKLHNASTNDTANLGELLIKCLNTDPCFFFISPLVN